MTRFRRVVIVGGGTAGWMAAAALSKTLGDELQITLVESDEIGTVGVGEATIPPIKNFQLLLEMDEAEFLGAVNGTFKLGIEFENWGRLGESYFHPFGSIGADAWMAQFHHFWLRAKKEGDDRDIGEYSLETCMARAGKFATQAPREPIYAYHFDATLYARLLRQFSEKLGVRRIEGKVVDVATHPESGFIEAVSLEDGHRIDGDLFIDCSGFRGLLIEQTLRTGWEDWSHWLRNDSAVAVQTESVAPPPPFTLSTARSCGWQWKIPLQNRVGNGLVFSSAYMSNDEACKLLLDNLDGKPLTDVRPIRFRTGRRIKQWNKNCIALGLSSGFLEPLESTSIHLIQNNIIRLIKLFPGEEIRPEEIDQYNHDAKLEVDYIRDFIILHYHATDRADSQYWKDCRDMEVPETLAHRLRLFRASGRIFREFGELFSENSWIAVMLGQDVMPDDYHPYADKATKKQLQDYLLDIRTSIAGAVARQASHREFVTKFCAKPVS